MRALQHGLVDDARVVVQPARQAQVERHAAVRALAPQLAEQQPQVAQRRLRIRVPRQRGACRTRAPPYAQESACTEVRAQPSSQLQQCEGREAPPRLYRPPVQGLLQWRSSFTSGCGILAVTHKGSVMPCASPGPQFFAKHSCPFACPSRLMAV